MWPQTSRLPLRPREAARPDTPAVVCRNVGWADSDTGGDSRLSPAHSEGLSPPAARRPRPSPRPVVQPRSAFALEIEASVCVSLKASLSGVSDLPGDAVFLRSAAHWVGGLYLHPVFCLYPQQGSPDTPILCVLTKGAWTPTPPCGPSPPHGSAEDDLRRQVCLQQHIPALWTATCCVFLWGQK